MLSGLELVIALIAVAAGATVMGTVSFGMGLVVAPVLLLFLPPQQVVVIVNAVISIVLMMVVFQTRRHLDLRLVWPMVLGGLVAVPLGVLFLSSANPTVLRLTIALVILVLGVSSLFDVQPPLARSRYAGLVYGYFCSLSVSTLSIGGPLAAIFVIAQRWSREAMRATLAFYFLSGYVLAFILYGWVGLVKLSTLANIGILMPGLLAGVGLASLIVRRINERVFRYVAIGVIIAGSLMLLGREVANL